jgi:2-polyprenyl-3-methyl-5-hydroxy-6-metoxy-1,4-benzoquinol methylase
MPSARRSDTAHFAERIRQLVDREKERTSSPEAAKVYAKNQARRFKITYDLCCQLVPDTNAVVCDVGRSPFTERLSNRYAQVWSLGLPLDEDDGGHRETNALRDVPHIACDLNSSIDVDRWPRESVRFDLIVCAETIEHLHTPPELALMMLSSLLKPQGLLLVTTPNACGIARRLKLLLGSNPFERIRYYALNPGHFREYTRREMIEMGETAGLKVRECRTINFYKQRLAVFDWIKIPPPFRDSLVAVYAAVSTSGFPA